MEIKFSVLVLNAIVCNSAQLTLRQLLLISAANSLLCTDMSGATVCGRRDGQQCHRSVAVAACEAAIVSSAA